jgi:hypothetical protein
MADETRTPPPEGFAARRVTVVSCWMCGISLQRNQMVPDGGSACSDVRWYCRDTQACTERWTSPPHQARAAGAAPGRGAVAASLSRQRRRPLPTRPCRSGMPHGRCRGGGKPRPGAAIRRSQDAAAGDRRVDRTGRPPLEVLTPARSPSSPPPTSTLDTDSGMTRHVPGSFCRSPGRPSLRPGSALRR